MIDQAEIHRLVYSSKVENRLEAAQLLKKIFPQLVNKFQAWSDLCMLTADNDNGVRRGAALAMGATFDYIPDKIQGWRDLCRLMTDEDNNVRRGAALALGIAFGHIPDKTQGWQDLIRLTADEDIVVRQVAIGALGAAFGHIPDKTQGWQDLIRLTANEDNNVRRGAALALGAAFVHIPNKTQGWQDLHRLMVDEDNNVRWGTALAIGAAFGYIPDKKQGWQDLIRLATDKDSGVRWGAVSALGAAFSHIPDKAQGWQDLHRSMADEDNNVRRGAALALRTAFGHIPDKTQGWQDLHRLTVDKDSSVRHGAVSALGLAFGHIPDKIQGWQDLHRLTVDEDSNVRLGSALAIGAAFGYIPDKTQGSQDLCRLMADEDRGVRWGAAFALGDVFGHIPDKIQGWQDLDRLTKDSDSFVRSQSFHSLGRASIIQATEADNDESFQRYLTQAIDFFERSSKESVFNPVKFCLPFYRSFYFITFRGMEAQSEASRSLIEAKSAIGHSKSKEVLYEAVESLSQALIDVQNAKEATIQDRKFYLDALKKSCDRAEGLMYEADDRTPGAAKTIERGLRIIKQNIKAELAEIEANGLRLLEATRHTPFEPITSRMVGRIRGLSDIEYGFNAESIMDDVVLDIWIMCSFLPSESKKSVYKLENWDALDFEAKVPLFKKAITHCVTQMEHFSKQIKDKDDQIAYLRGEVLARLETINFHVFKMNIRSGEVAQSLRALEYELQKIKKIKDDLDRLGQKLDYLNIHQQQALQGLHEDAPKLIKYLEEIIKNDSPEDPGKQNIPDSLKQELLNKLQALNASPEGAALDLAAALSSIISLILTFYSMSH